MQVCAHASACCNLGRPSNPSSLRTSVGTTTAADLVTQSRGDTSETQVVHEPFAEEVRNDLSKLPDMEVFPATTDMAVSPATTDGMLSPAAERVQDGNDRSFVYTSPHADDRAIALPFSPTPKHVGLHGMDGAEVSRVPSGYKAELFFLSTSEKMAGSVMLVGT